MTVFSLKLGTITKYLPKDFTLPDDSLYDKEVIEAHAAGTLRGYMREQAGSRVWYLVMDGGKNEANPTKSMA